jgi:hypothetical protein
MRPSVRHRQPYLEAVATAQFSRQKNTTYYEVCSEPVMILLFPQCFIYAKLFTQTRLDIALIVVIHHN